jgi:hypothetical protein
VKKKGEGESGGPAGKLGWAAWAERVAGAFLFFFLFQTSFSNPFSTQIQIKLFANFSQKFYRLLMDCEQGWSLKKSFGQQATVPQRDCSVATRSNLAQHIEA